MNDMKPNIAGEPALADVARLERQVRQLCKKLTRKEIVPAPTSGTGTISEQCSYMLYLIDRIKGSIRS